MEIVIPAFGKRILLLAFAALALHLPAQTLYLSPDEGGGEMPLQKNDAQHPCLSAEQYALLGKQIEENCRHLGLPLTQQKTMTTSLSWPLQTKTGFNDCSYYTISAYVDQNPAASTYSDWNCGSTTYDGHKGTDIAIWPFPFYKMDNDQVEVIAAAAGTIITKTDGNFDKNCGTNNLTPNYIAIQHADGSTALYLHMKMNSLTPKTVGQTVVAGEFLGRVGSSGSSTGPHLHFEVWSGSTVGTLNDPFSGTCNTLNPSTWWTAQKPYTEPAVIKASVHPIAAVFPACPATETPNEDSCFTAGASAKFYIFMRNETNGMTVNMKILNPNATTFTSWTHSSTVNITGSYWYYTKTLPVTPGTYTFEATYNGITCLKQFKIGCTPAGITEQEELQGLSLSPNPSSEKFSIHGEGGPNENYTFTLRTVSGQVVQEEKYKAGSGGIDLQISTAELTNGIYFLSIESQHAKQVRKVLVQHP
ncbi:MAG: peptidoglycan DD-metalloendopeptidase family protein [Bacteroidia bacterium]